MRRRAVSCCLALGLALAAGGPADASLLKRWIEGPVRYIAEKDELKVYKKLKTDEERSLFIERFWKRRDPAPETLSNDYRQLFWERVRDANSLFLDSGIPGWRTDRGKIYTLYGPPTRIEELSNLDSDVSATSGRGVIRWFYEGRPGGRTDGNPVVIVPFVRQATGEYRLSYDPRLASVFFDELAHREGWYREIDNFAEVFGAPRQTELSVMLDLGRMQEVPPQAQVLLERVETVETYKTEPLDVEVTRYVHPDKGGILVVVTANVTQIPPEIRPAVVTRFRSLDATNEPRMLGEDSFRIWERNGHRLAQGRLVLPPGDYDVTVLLANPKTAATSLHRGSFRAPEPSPQLRHSDVVWAWDISPLEFASMATHDEPFTIGPYHVVPRIATTFLQGETLRLFYEIYGGQPPYRITYQIEGREVDDRWIPLGQPSIAEQNVPAQGWALPTSEQWPSGEYRVRIDIRDEGDRLVSTEVPFSLGAPASP